MHRPWLIGLVVLCVTAFAHFGYYYVVDPQPACGETPGQMWKATEPRPPPVSLMAPISERYVRDRLYLMGLSYGMALGFTAYAAARSRGARRQGVAGVIGGLSLTGFLAAAGCFLLGCCGSPMLTVYLALFGSALAGFKDIFVFVLTALSVLIGLLWRWRCKPAAGGACCASGCGCDAAGK